MHADVVGGAISRNGGKVGKDVALVGRLPQLHRDSVTATVVGREPPVLSLNLWTDWLFIPRRSCEHRPQVT